MKTIIGTIMTAILLVTPVVSVSEVAAQERVMPVRSRMYLEMSKAEQDQFIADWGQIVSQFLGNHGRSVPDVLITPEAVAAIKPFVDAYPRRAGTEQNGNRCQFGRDNLAEVLKRWKQNRPAIMSAFTLERDLRERPDGNGPEWYDTLEPRVGTYVAMVQSEFCSDLQSATGMLGMFQLTRPAAARYGLKIGDQGAPHVSEERRDTAKSAAAAARMLKATLNSSPGPRTETDPFIFLTGLSRYYQGADSAEDSFLSLPPSNNKPFWSVFPRIDTNDLNKILLKIFAAAIVLEKPDAFVDNVKR